MDYSNLTITGRLGRDAEMKKTPNGKAVCEFSVATGHREKGDNVTMWVKVALWENAAEKLAPYLTKGTQVLVSGEPRVRAYTSNNGNAGAELSIAYPQVRLLGGGNRNNDGGGGYDDGETDNVPF